jgi:hypothetical protein
LVAVAVPVELDDVPLCELVEPIGAAGGVGAGVPPPPEAVTVSVKLHVPVSFDVSPSVPVTMYVAAAKVPLVVTAPLEDTMTWVEFAEVPSV